MKASDNNITVERQPREEELPELAVRILSDFARIVAAEARLVESNIVAAANSLVDRVYISAILIVLAAAGVVAMLSSVVLLLHHWMPWWQVLGAVGIVALVVAAVLRRTLIPRPAAQGVSLAH
jgi:Putative Actinobacterial Holin-X, holin superfamily III